MEKLRLVNSIKKAFSIIIPVVVFILTFQYFTLGESLAFSFLSFCVYFAIFDDVHDSDNS